jgi:hypothetical protein
MIVMMLLAIVYINLAKNVVRDAIPGTIRVFAAFEQSVEKKEFYLGTLQNKSSVSICGNIAQRIGKTRTL